MQHTNIECIAYAIDYAIKQVDEMADGLSENTFAPDLAVSLGEVSEVLSKARYGVMQLGQEESKR